MGFLDRFKKFTQAMPESDWRMEMLRDRETSKPKLALLGIRL